MLNKSDAGELVHDQLLPLLTKERERLSLVDRWYRWQHDDPVIPRGSTREHRYLLQLAKTPWLGLVVTNVAQALYVDGYRSPDQPQNSRPWRTWQANDLDNRQIAIHEAALAYGQAFATVLPGDLQGEPTSVIRGVSPRKMVTVYADPAEDDWPMYALRGEPNGPDKTWVLRLYDDEVIHFLSASATADKVDYIEYRSHDAGVCPVVRYANKLDLEGRTDGEVEPLIPLASRINKTTYDRLLTQHFASWKVRTVSGMSEPDTEAEANRAKLQLRQDDLLVAEDADTKFGTLDETPLDGFIRAHESDVATLAAVAQIPTTSLTGNVANLSADAIAELRAGLTQKGVQRQKSFGKSHEQALRLAASLEGDPDSARDVMAHVTWADMQIRSLSQAVDALGKAAQMLQVPPRALWTRIPGVSKSDADEWAAMAAEGDAFAQLSAMLNAQPPA